MAASAAQMIELVPPPSAPAPSSAQRTLLEDPSRFREALVASGGNITRAGRALGVCKQYAMWLARHFNLNAEAAELRKRSGAPVIGRPRVIS